MRANKIRMIAAYSLPGITRAGSKGMISARNIKAPHFCFALQVSCFALFKKRKKNSPGSEPNSFRGTKIVKNGTTTKSTFISKKFNTFAMNKKSRIQYATPCRTTSSTDT